MIVKRRGALLAAVVMLLALMVPFGFTAGAEEAVKIYTAADLMAIDDSAANVNTNYILMADIDLKGAEWEPLFSGTYTYMGTFDGNGHVVRNFKVTGTHKYAGLFAKAQQKRRVLNDPSSTANIVNLGVENVTINVTNNGDVYAGAIIGWFGAEDRSTELLPYTSGSLANCYASGSVSVTSTKVGSFCEAGGLAGYIFTGTVKNSAFTGKVQGVAKAAQSGSAFVTVHAGGLVGYMNNSEISGSYAAGSITAQLADGATGKAKLFAGGLLANSNSGANTINNSVVVADIVTAGAKANVTESVSTALAQMSLGEVNNSYYAEGMVVQDVKGAVDLSSQKGKAVMVEEMFTAAWQTGTLKFGTTDTLTFKNGALPMQKYQASAIQGASIGAIAAQTATGKALKPAVTVKLGGKTLTKNTDYLAIYTNHTMPCENKASAIVLGIGKYSGVIYRNFSIQVGTPSLKLSQSKDGVTVNWAAVPTAGRYKVERKSGSGQWITVKPAVYTNSYVDDTVKKGEVYTYRVKAYYEKEDVQNAANSIVLEGAWSKEVSITVTVSVGGAESTTTTTTPATTTTTTTLQNTSSSSVSSTTSATEGTSESTTVSQDTVVTDPTTQPSDGQQGVETPDASTTPEQEPSFWWVWLFLIVPVALAPVTILMLRQKQ